MRNFRMKYTWSMAHVKSLEFQYNEICTSIKGTIFVHDSLKSSALTMTPNVWFSSTWSVSAMGSWTLPSCGWVLSRKSSNLLETTWAFLALNKETVITKCHAALLLMDDGTHFCDRCSQWSASLTWVPLLSWGVGTPYRLSLVNLDQS